MEEANKCESTNNYFGENEIRVTITLKEYRELVEIKGRVTAVENYMKNSSYTNEKIICRILGVEYGDEE